MSLVDKIKDAAGPVIEMAAPMVAQAIEKATPLVEQAKEMAAPYLEQAKDKASPYAEKVAVTAGPIVEQAFEKAGPLVEKASGIAVDCLGAAVFTVDKATGGRYHDQFENVSQMVGNVLNRNGKAGGSS